MLHVDIPTLPELRALTRSRADASVSIYLPTTPETQNITLSRIALGNLARTALAQLDAAGVDKRQRAALEEELDALREDDEFWRLQAHSLAILATPDSLRTFRLATMVTEMVEVSDRFYLKPLLRAVALPQHAFVLALSEGGARMVEVYADLPPSEVRVPGLPDSAADAAGRASLNNLTQGTRHANAEGKKKLLLAYARKVDSALRPVLAGRETPLILAATEPLAPMFRSVNSYPALLDETIATNPDRMADTALASAARPVLDGLYASQIKAATALFHDRMGQSRASTDLHTIARAATFGAVDTLLVDMDEVVPGTVDATDGTVTLAAQADANSFGVIDEIAGRAMLAGAQVLAVRRQDMPDGAAVAAIFRYAL